MRTAISPWLASHYRPGVLTDFGDRGRDELRFLTGPIFFMELSYGIKDNRIGVAHVKLSATMPTNSQANPFA